MTASIEINGKVRKVDFSLPIDISIPLMNGSGNVTAFHIPPPEFFPFVAGSFVGDVEKGGSCNVFSITFNPHGNGTHTETVGHISKEKQTINACLREFFFEARLITISPEKSGEDRVVTKRQLEQLLGGKCPHALIIRTLPNGKEKLNAAYSGTNPAYLEEAAAAYIKALNVTHLLLDLPSIDREDDGGRLLAHHAFWNFPASPRLDATITEMIYADNSIADDHYLLNIQIASFESDASPSKPVLYRFL